MENQTATQAKKITVENTVNAPAEKFGNSGQRQRHHQMGQPLSRLAYAKAEND